jgi:hypothetical protein
MQKKLQEISRNDAVSKDKFLLDTKCFAKLFQPNLISLIAAALRAIMMKNKNLRIAFVVGSRVARFFLVQHTKKGKTFQNDRKYTKGP